MAGVCPLQPALRSLLSSLLVLSPEPDTGSFNSKTDIGMRLADSEHSHIYNYKKICIHHFCWFHFFFLHYIMLPFLTGVCRLLFSLLHIFKIIVRVVVKTEQDIFLLASSQPIFEPANRRGEAVAACPRCSAGKRWKKGEGAGFSD